MPFRPANRSTASSSLVRLSGEGAPCLPTSCHTREWLVPASSRHSSLGKRKTGVGRELPFRNGFRVPTAAADYPAVIAERLIGQHRYRRAPVIRGCVFADSAFLWSDLPRIIRLDRQDRASFELGARAKV